MGAIFGNFLFIFLVFLIIIFFALIISFLCRRKKAMCPIIKVAAFFTLRFAFAYNAINNIFCLNIVFPSAFIALIKTMIFSAFHKFTHLGKSTPF